MKIVDSKIQGSCLQEFTAKYLEEHKDLIKYVKEETEKQLLLHSVSQQRELLLAFAGWLYGNLDKEVEQRIVDDYLNSK